MRSTPLVIALLVSSLASCGGGGGDNSTADHSEADHSTAENSTVDNSTAPSAAPGADAPASGSIVAVDNNPLRLSPAPVFSASSREVTYDDCFPPHDDVVPGDVMRERIETYDSFKKEIYAYVATHTATAVAPSVLGDRSGIRVTFDSTYSNQGPEARTVWEALHLRGAMVQLLVKNLRLISGVPQVHSTFITTPQQTGDISFGHERLPYKPGDGTQHTYEIVGEINHGPEQNTKASWTEKWTFLGVEEGSSIGGRSVPYTCVFRMEASSEKASVTQDMYFHPFSGLKVLEYHPEAPRPLVKETASDTAAERRALKNQ